MDKEKKPPQLPFSALRWELILPKIISLAIINSKNIVQKMKEKGFRNKPTGNWSIFKSSFRWGKKFMGNDQTYIVLLWGKCNETPRNASDFHKVFAFAPPYILCFPWHLPPTDKLVDQLPTPHPPPPLLVLDCPQRRPFAFKTRQWLPSRLLSPCLADKQGISVDVTQTKYIWLLMPPPCLCHRVRGSGKVLRNAANSLFETQTSKITQL